MQGIRLDQRVDRRDFLKSAAAGGAAVVTGGVLAACGGTSSQATTTTATGKASAGGDLRLAMALGSSDDTLVAGAGRTLIDAERLLAMYSGVVRLSERADSVEHDLAEELTPNASATEWTIRLLPDVTFHNGKTVTAADIEFTFNRIRDPKNPLNGSQSLTLVDRIKVMDPRTVRVYMKAPYGSFPQFISPVEQFGVVPVGYDPAHPVGTGPFKLSSFTPGQRSVFERNRSYHREGLPHLDTLTIIDYADPTSAMNALSAGEIDLFAGAPGTALSLAKSQNLQTYAGLIGHWAPFVMRLDSAPFQDARVRQAFRLMVDRPALIQAAFAGQAVVGNDVFCPNDPNYDSSLTRHQDIDMAKSLLKQAGQQNLAVKLVTAEVSNGVIAMAQVFVQQAAAAGVKVSLDQVPVTTLYGPNKYQWTFAQDNWGTRFYLNQVAQSQLPGSAKDETHWSHSQYGAKYVALYNAAQATLDAAKVRELVHEMQRMDFDYGGYIIPAYDKQLSVYGKRVRGLQEQAVYPISQQNFENLWLA